jgi:molecular chaperone DnaK
LKEAHKSQDAASIDAATSELNAAWTAASEEMYKATQGQGGPQDGGAGQQGQPGGQSNGGGENVTDAEFEEVK